MKFNLQRFGGGKGGTTIQSTYEPTEFELKLQQLEVGYTEAIMPNALALNSKAKNLLDAADAAMTNIAASIGGFAESAAGRIEAYINADQEAIERINIDYLSLAENIDTLINAANSDWFDWMQEQGEVSANNIGNIKSDMRNKVEGYKSTISAYDTKANGYATPIKAYEDRVSDYNPTITAYNSRVANYDSTISAYIAKADNYSVPISNYEDRVSDYNPTITAYNSEADGYFSSVNAYNNHVTEVKAYYDPTISAEANSALKTAETNFNSLYPDAANSYDTIQSGYASAEQNISAKTSSLPSALNSSVTLVSGALDTLTGDYKSATITGATPGTSMKHDLTKVSTTNYNDLDALAPKFADAADRINPELDTIASNAQGLTTLGSFYNNLDTLIPEYNANYKYANSEDTIHSNFEKLIDGNLPETWQNHMERSIKTTLQNTVGKVVNDLASRGVLNSSVANQALYDIERNASDEVAKQYLNNIQTESQLVQNRWQVKEQGLNDQRLILDDMLSFYVQGLNLQLQAKENKFQNLMNAFMDEANIYNYQLNNSSQVLTHQATLANNKFTAQSLAITSTDRMYEQMLQDKYNMLQGQSASTQGKYGVWQSAYQLNQDIFARRLSEKQLKIQQWNTLLQNQHDGYRLRDNMLNQHDNLLRQRDSIFQLQDSLLRQRDGVYQLQDNLLRQRDGISQEQDNLLRQRDSIFQLQDGLLRQRDGIYQLQDNLLRQRDGISQEQDNLLRQRDSIFQLQDSLLRQRDGVYQLQDNLLRQRDNIFQLQDGLLQQLNQIEFNYWQAMKSVYDTNWLHEIEKLNKMINLAGIELQCFDEVYKFREESISLLSKPLVISAAAQEAAQQPALRLWNASTGLNQSATGVLVALSNQGTRTQTTQSGGNFLGGILSAGLTAFAGGWGDATGKGLFG